MVSKPFQARYERRCSVCKEMIRIGQFAVFPKRGEDDLAHVDCSPTKDSSPVSQEPKPVAAYPGAPPVEASSTVYIQIAAWIPSESVEEVVKTIVKVKGAPRPR